MSVIQSKVADILAGGNLGEVVNDFSLQIASANGSGSQTSNMVLVRALFRMGIPVSGKNLFPSNIQGLPTWYTIRCSHAGYVARQPSAPVVVLMNPETAIKDLAGLESGGVCFYPDDLKIDLSRQDVTYYPMPVKQLTSVPEVPRHLRTYIGNMVYVGVLAQVLKIEMSALEAALDWQFGGRTKLVNANLPTIKAAYEWAAANITKRDQYRVERMNATAGYMLVDGNAAGGLGSVYGGMTVTAWYPITPSTSLADEMSAFASTLRRDPDGKANYAIVQAEDELAAIGMVLGAGWAGARSMTTTSGPGISLMQEFLGFGYYAEIPAVIWDIQRVGPSTGMPTRVSQGDLFACYYASHGDTKHICLLPGSVNECFEFGWRSLDIAEQYQTPVFVLSDLDLGMNQWMTKPFEYPTEPINRGKVLTAEQVEKNGFRRYADIDGDGIAYRTLPGTNHPRASYFTRGSGHDADARYTEEPEKYRGNLERLRRKIELSREHLPAPVVEMTAGAKIGIIGFGSTDPAIIEARDTLTASGVQTSYLRIRALPSAASVVDFVRSHERVYVVEINADGQLRLILQSDMPELAARLRPVCMLDGMPFTAAWIIGQINSQEQK
ncbi:pyruvate ferredoxin oxidoreductase [Anaerolineae bacterium]|nr:2-oxoglutarate synthase subunit KorA [Chloroflexota bacterium]GBL36939.1 2-oxoglutarate synthase subunit KorA [Anaerolineaceae bacterium]GDX67016.1 pyruvate ferredoxin oxidoreductase [Anaerolineae bacterium]